MSGNLYEDGLLLNSEREDMTKIHIESYNALFDSTNYRGLLALMAEDIPKVQLDYDPVDNCPVAAIWYESIDIHYPLKDEVARDSRLIPAEARLRKLDYAGQLSVVIGCQLYGSGSADSMSVEFGKIPVMLKSRRCYLHNKTRLEMIQHWEDEREIGGYFICNGNERAIRMLIGTRRNKCIAISRGTYEKRDHKYTDKGIIYRGVRPDQSSITNILHYVSDGTATLEFVLNKGQYLIPFVLLLRACKDCTDREIYEQCMIGEENNTFISERVELMLRLSKQSGVRSQTEALALLGSKFRPILYLSKHASDVDCGQYIIDRFILVNCTTKEQKWYLLIHMLRKLYALADGQIQPESTDSMDTQEALLPGHLIGRIIKEQLEIFLSTLQLSLNRIISSTPEMVQFDDTRFLRQLIDQHAARTDIGKKLAYFMNTGNLKSNSGLDLQQISGFTIVAERINYARFLSHFRAIHRGQFFTEMRTTSVRKLLPGCWGFLCPVHTPDGTPCGLLNHVTLQCQVVTHHLMNDILTQQLIRALQDLNMVPRVNLDVDNQWILILLDGIVVGGVLQRHAKRFCQELRWLKLQEDSAVPPFLEIVENLDASIRLFPEILLSTEAGRFIRPVRNLIKNEIEWISPIEQMFMEIACREQDLKPRHTHVELNAEAQLSALAACTPLSDFNQSPRNMYQCQMFKQTMGIHCHNYMHRADNKSYRIQNPQAPISKNNTYDVLGLDDYPFGTNAIVAVLSYTGYDMEDSMIICKEAMQRGFKHGVVYKTETIDLYENKKKNTPLHLSFNNIDPKTGEKFEKALSVDGLPIPGTKLVSGCPLYATLHDMKQQIFVHRYRYSEACVVEEVQLLGSGSSHNRRRTKATIKLRYTRCPTIGDKFASRAGQKGTMAALWPQQDMPWTESGMQPDLIINPHAFPSRMTIGMLIESMAGKAGCLWGQTQDTSPFRWSEDNRAIDHWGKMLSKAGYDYYGSEPMYSGTSGQLFTANLYIGVVYYQRLRHMVSDKYQVRSTGPVDNITGQPVKGRKRGGGIRLGEMERDALISHGCSFIMQDRLLNCSDAIVHRGCKGCGLILSTVNTVNGWYCNLCETSKDVVKVVIPQVYLYLSNELAAMGLKLKLDFKSKF